MIFKGILNQTVELKVANYQFPYITTPGDDDSNWLNIYIKVQSNFGNWQTVDPSLTTGEFKRLSKWFDDLSKNIDVEYKEQYFTEPNLEFNLIASNSNTKTVRIIFSAESKPKSAKEDSEYYVDCALTNAEIAAASKELKDELNKFPPR